MKRCTHCELNINTRLESCVLCDRTLINSDNEKQNPIIYPRYQARSYAYSLIKKVSFWFVVATFVIGALINFITWDLQPFLWAPILSIGLMYLYNFLSIYFEDFWCGTFGRLLLSNYLLVSFFVLVVDYSTGYQGWSLNYFIPLTGIGTASLLGVMSAYRRSFWSNEVGYLLFVLVINLLPIILFLLGVSTVLWTGVMSLAFVVIIFTSLFIFQRNKVQAEIIKRLHY